MKYLLLISNLFVALTLSAQETSINDNWRFSKDKNEWVNVNLPHTWNNVDAHDDKRGMYMGEGTYTKSIFIEETNRNNIYLKFEGANQLSKIYVNDQLAGTHKGGYTAFVVDISEYVKFGSENKVLVVVNNAIDTNIPPLSADFTFYGGIYRDAWLIRKSDVQFNITDGSTKGVYFSQSTTEKSAVLNVKSVISSKSKTKATVQITVFDPKMIEIENYNQKVSLKEGSNELKSTISIDQPKLWSPDHPDLYTVRVKILDSKNQLTYDEFVGKTGFRWYKMNENRSFSLNGKTIKLIGVNRHQDFEGLGNALSNATHRRDIKLLKEMGANFIRIAHYPQDPSLLEACDELGIIAWEEIPIVNYITLSKEFEENSSQMLKEMIRQHYNHPSVVMWGFMNEVLLRPNKAYKENEGLEEKEYLPLVDALHKKLDSIVKAEDPERLSTIAHHANYDIYDRAGLNNTTDIVGWNIYYGWYGDDPEWKRAGIFLDDFNSDHPSKGIIVGEYGAGADPRIHAVDPKRFDFTIEWQTLYHTNYWRQIKARDHVLGAAIWNFVDFGSEGRTDAVPRINSKGILTVDRKIKDSYLFYQAALSDTPILSIGNTQWRERKGISSENNALTHPIVIFTNQKEVEVFINEVTLGVFQTKDYQINIDVPFKDGKNLVMVKANSLTDFANYDVEIIPENLRSLSSKDVNISMNMGSHVHFHHPSSGVIWIPEKPYKEGSLGYLGGDVLLSRGWKVGVGSEIFGSDLEPVYQTHRDTIEGFKMDVPNGYYEVTLHFAEIHAKEKREKLANNLGSDRSENVSNVNRSFLAEINNDQTISIKNLADFQATPIKTRLLVSNGQGIEIKFKAQSGTAFLSGIEIKGL